MPARSAPQSRTAAGGGAQQASSATWLLLVYSVPAQPSRKRATVWREIKKLGAVYLRAGVCVVPEQSATLTSLRGLAGRIEQMDGQACVVEHGQLDPVRSAGLRAEFQTARSAEYAEITGEAEQLLEHIARETEHREFTYAELEVLEQDLGKLKRWTEQVHQRDYFGESSYAAVQTLLERCDAALETFLEQASEEVAGRR